MVRKSFRKGHDRLDAILATIRKAAELTRDELAARLGIDQSVVSKTERREDMLLSTLMDYLSAAGVEDAKMVVHVNGREIELDLRSLQQRAKL